ncbi:MAG: 4-hydroxy-tetrahydrodipicolinate synthase [Gammaproteobacteria bacterium]|jgi:4-hydroxy-tetrahydrodipicolinate synthase|nr:4-hydroxy-tetrahydrodipicolinate synthase [Gammaproteobacteria bacterium]NCF82472.1 4-hydroxy-tetrahydrodipicolinate synthase [Pseudomonadota bacterium]
MFQGSIVAMVTPMSRDGDVDEAALASLVEFHVENGTDAIVAVGTTGESATLDPEEHCQVIGRIVDLVGSRVPVIGGTGANSTREAIHLTAMAKDAGVDACLLVTPYYNKPTQQGLFQHFKAIADAVDIPQILYNVPGRTACDMLPDVVEELSRVDNIIGIKEASGELARFGELVSRCGPGFDVLSGEDHLALQGMLAGARGVISVTANVAPAAVHEMCALALDGDFEGAGRVDERLRDLHAAMFFESNPIPAKWALQDMGMIQDGIRLPLTPLSEIYHERVRAALHSAERVSV